MPEPDDRFPSRIRIGDGPEMPCRIVAMDIDGPLISGVREPGGTFTLDRASLPSGWSPYDALTHLRFEFDGPTFPAGQSFAERVAALIECYGLTPAPPPPSRPSTMADLADVVAQQHRLVDAQTLGEIPVGDPRVLEADDLLDYFSQVRTAADFMVDADGAPTNPELESAKNWAAGGSTCAHVCGPDPGHVCDARAVTMLNHKLPSGGTRELPLCRPCADAEGVAEPGDGEAKPAADRHAALRDFATGDWVEAPVQRPPVDRLFVIAATRVQFTEWCHDVGISSRSRRAVHVTDHRQLDGAPHGLRYLVLGWPAGPGFTEVVIRDMLRCRDALGVSAEEYRAWRESLAQESGVRR